MNPTRITDEQRQALASQHDGPVPAEDAETHQTYFIYPEALHQRAMQALREQDDIAAIQQGIDDMEAGRLIPLEEAEAEIRQDLRFPPRER